MVVIEITVIESIQTIKNYATHGHHNGKMKFTVDGACDGDPARNVVLRRSMHAKMVIPLRSTAVARRDAEPPKRHGFHIASIQRP